MGGMALFVKCASVRAKHYVARVSRIFSIGENTAMRIQVKQVDTMCVENVESLLENFAAAWNAHDIEAMMDCMSEDCEFLASAGPECCGQRYVGRRAVRQAYLAILEGMPDARWSSGQYFVDGETAFSLWTLTGTTPDGTKVAVDGVDHFVVRGGRIAIKNAFRKAKQPPGCPAASVHVRPT